MTSRFVFRPGAREEVLDARSWYAAHRAELGDELAHTVSETLDLIDAHPTAYPLVRGDVRRAVLTRFPYGLFYRVVGDTVEVLAFLHHRRHPRVWRRR